MTAFYPVKTDDGTISLFNTEVNDIYHSKIGAYTEALNKFVIPSGILEFAKSADEINILDICFGLGYNSKVAVHEILKVNPKCNINVTALELDPDVLGFSMLVDFPFSDKEVLDVFNNSVVNSININAFLDKFNNDVIFTEPFIGYLESDRIESTSYLQKDALLHNIYYRTISNRNILSEKIDSISNRLNVSIYCEDGRLSIKSLKPCYHYILHDPFTPSKVPTLWTVEFFKELHRILDDNGNITTYSCSAAIRAALMESGFSIGKTDPVGRKDGGTIAYKYSSLIKNELTDYDLGLIQTNAGIPYYDPELNFSINEIIKYRESLQNNSGRMSSGKYLKMYSVKNSV